MAEEVKEMSLLERIVGVFSDPRRTFTALSQRPEWLAPVIIMIVLAMVYSYSTYEIQMEETITIMEERFADNPNVSVEQQEEILDGIEERFDKPWVKVVSFLLGPIIGVLFIVVVVAGAFYFGGNVVLGGKATFKQVLSIWSYAHLVSVPETIIKLPLILSRRTLRVPISPAATLSPEASETFLYRLLAKFDLFLIVQLALVTIGLAVVYNFPTRKTATLVISLWVIWIVVSLAGGSLLKGGLMMG